MLICLHINKMNDIIYYVKIESIYFDHITEFVKLYYIFYVKTHEMMIDYIFWCIYGCAISYRHYTVCLNRNYYL